MNRSTAELEDRIRAVFAAQAGAIDELAAQSPKGRAGLGVHDGQYRAEERHLLVVPDQAVARPKVPRRRLALGAAAALALVATGVVTVRNRQATTDAVDPADTLAVVTGPALTLPGDEVLSADPLVVQAPLGPTPSFDTSALGDELRFDPVDSLADPAVKARLDGLAAEVDGLRSSVPEAAGLRVPKTTVIGWLDGKLWLSTVAERPIPAGEAVDDPRATALRYSWVSFEDGSAVFETPGAAVAADSVEGIALSRNSADPFARGVAGAFPTRPPLYVDRLPSAVAVVSYADADQRWWVRPRGGVAAFPAQLTRNETYTMRAYSADGTVIGEQSGDSGPAADPRYLAEVGERLLAVPTFDEHDQPVTLGAAGRPTILLYGGSWCPPCQDHLAEVVSTLDALGDTVDVYAVPFAEQEPGTWPQLAAWHYPRIRFQLPVPATPGRDGTAYPMDIDSVPTVLVIGADGVILGRLGFEDLGSKLAELGLSPPPQGAG